MRFTPKTEEQLIAENMIPEGIYPFEVVYTEDRVSQKGNEMIVLKLKVFTESGERFVTDYLMEAMAFKLRHAAEACGLLDQYNEGEITSFHFNGQAGMVKIGVEKDKTGQYPDKNVVRDYAVERPAKTSEKHSAAKANAYQPEGDLDDEIPF